MNKFSFKKNNFLWYKWLYKLKNKNLKKKFYNNKKNNKMNKKVN